MLVYNIFNFLESISVINSKNCACYHQQAFVLIRTQDKIWLYFLWHSKNIFWTKPCVTVIPTHTSHLVQNSLSDNVEKFWSKELRPLNSPALNPLDFCIWRKDRNKQIQTTQPGISAGSYCYNIRWIIQETSGKNFRDRIRITIAIKGGYITKFHSRTIPLMSSTIHFYNIQIFPDLIFSYFHHIVNVMRYNVANSVLHHV